ncbi:alpha-glycosidase [Embleya scabrispora]|uniref:Alpha-glycosidase n=1 Tax=Embleya scabrispora TaxID=159449 RepID=A0A1T3NND2_9ACTN|nr:alpha-glycosidase [Embleya scabrispora]
MHPPETLCNTVAHHDGSPGYVSNPSPQPGDRVELFVRARTDAGTRRVHVRTKLDGEPVFTEARVDRVDGDETWWRVEVEVGSTEFGYRFLLDTPTGNRWLTGAGIASRDVPDTGDFTLTTHPAPPAWAADAVVYQIFPDRFARSARQSDILPDWATPAAWDDPVPWGTPGALQQIYGGDLWGVLDRLDHIRALGANVLYLTPFFPARSNHRYDATTFDRVDPLLGGDEALRALTAEAHRRGMRVIGDLTLNHSGDGHEWFRRGQAEPDSAEAGFYYFDGADRGRYASFCGVDTLPKFDHASAELRARLYEGAGSVVARYPRDFGLDGWRIDVAQSAGRHGTQDRNAEVARATRATLNAAAPDTLLLAEHQHDASASLRGDGWQGTMAYSGFTRPVWGWLADAPLTEFWGVPGPIPAYGGAELAAVMRDFAALLPWRSYTHNLTLLDSHDTQRFRSMAGREHQHLGAALLFTLPGLPMVFAGDEVGVEGVHLEDGRRPFPWDPARWDHDTHRVYRDLIALRRGHRALREGGLRWLRCDADTVLFERWLPEETLLVQVDRASHAPIAAPAAAHSLTGGPDLRRGEPMPADGPAFHVWRVERP